MAPMTSSTNYLAVSNKDLCTGCGTCVDKCPVDAIRGQRGVVHVIEQEKCVSCGSCYDVCPFGAVERLSGEN